MPSYQIKAVLLGDSSVGKSSLIQYYCDNDITIGNTQNTQNTQNTPTIGIDFKIKRVDCRELGNNVNELKAYFWDTAGQERFRSIIRSYYKGINVLILVYDVSCIDTFNSISSWYDEFLQNCGMIDDNLLKVLIGNKIDLERKVSIESGEQYARDNDMLFYELSTKSLNVSIEHIFNGIILKRGQNTEGLTEYSSREPKSLLETISSIGSISKNNATAIKNTCCF